MAIHQIKQTKIVAITRPKRPKHGANETKQSVNWVLSRPNGPKYGYWLDRTYRNMGIGQTKYWYETDRTERNTRIVHTEQTEIWVFP